MNDILLNHADKTSSWSALGIAMGLHVVRMLAITGGYCISTVVLFYVTATINALDHMIGSRRYDASDTSRNNWVLALITFGEGRHNHHYPSTVRQGFYWWELEVTYYLLVVLSWFVIVKEVNPLPSKVRESNHHSQAE